MKTKVFAGLALIGLLIGGISNWPIPYDELNMSNTVYWLFVSLGSLSSAFLCALFIKEKPWKIAFLITLGVVVSTIFRIIYDTLIWDSSSHNLAPFEVIFSVFQALPFALIGAYFSLLFRRSKTKS